VEHAATAVQVILLHGQGFSDAGTVQQQGMGVIMEGQSRRVWERLKQGQTVQQQGLELSSWGGSAGVVQSDSSFERGQGEGGWGFGVWGPASA
jgi:hypothetical protein